MASSRTVPKAVLRWIRAKVRSTPVAMSIIKLRVHEDRSGEILDGPLRLSNRDKGAPAPVVSQGITAVQTDSFVQNGYCKLGLTLVD